MENAALLLLLAFLAITFLQSAFEKIFNWKENIDWLKGHFAKTLLKNAVPFALIQLLILEMISGVLCVVGGYELYFYNEKTTALYGAIFSCICLLMMLFGQRLAKDYDGARTIVLYFIPAVLAVYWLQA